MTRHNTPETMRAAVLTGHGGLDKLEYHADWPTPRPGSGDVLIKAGACGMNNTDINTRIGWYSPAVTEGTTAAGGIHGLASALTEEGGWGGGIAFPRIQGADLCGRVVALGEGVSEALMGERVLVDPWFRDWSTPLDLNRCRYFGSECDGGYADYVVAPASQVHPVETQLSDAELATFATAYVTAENILERAHAGAGDRVLIPGASGGVGSALVQLVRRRGGVPVALCGEAKAAAMRELTGTPVLPRETDDLTGALQAATGYDKVDIVADTVGGAMWPQYIRLLRRGGCYSCAGAIAGPIVAFDLRDFYLENLTFTGATITSPGLFATVVGYIERGEIKPQLAGTWKLSEIHRAQEAFLAKKHIGNFVITMD